MAFVDDITVLKQYADDCLDVDSLPWFGQIPDFPEDILDFVTSFNSSGEETPVPSLRPIPEARDAFCSSLSVSGSYSKRKASRRPPISDCAMSKHSQCRKDDDCSRLRKRQSNREAAFRYRQKMKEKDLTLNDVLRESVDAFNRAKSEYEKARDAFDALKRVIADMDAVKSPSLFC